MEARTEGRSSYCKYASLPNSCYGVGVTDARPPRGWRKMPLVYVDSFALGWSSAQWFRSGMPTVEGANGRKRASLWLQACPPALHSVNEILSML